MDAKIIRKFNNAKQRCRNKKDPSYKYYGGKDIKFLLSRKEMIQLWERDGAVNLTRPSIDRIDNEQDYVFDNCHFIEFEENRNKLRGNRAIETEISVEESLKTTRAIELKREKKRVSKEGD